MKTVFDLPAHPLFVHFPVVLIPLAAAAAVVLAVRPAWRPRYSTPLAVAAFVGAASAVLASRSGDELNAELKDRIGDLAEKHQDLGETTVILTIVFLVASVAIAVADRRAARAGAQIVSALASRGERVLRGGMALTAVLAVVATIWMIRTGHEGARIVWEDVIVDDG